MEKIKKALEQARKERGKNESAGLGSPRKPGVMVPVTEIEYTKTQSLGGSQQRMRESRLINAMGPGEYTDALKMLSTQVLQRMRENDWGVLGVTSPRRHAGKTTISINLGLSIAREVEYTVMVVDANLKHPGVHEYFGIDPNMGLSDYLTSDIELSDILINPSGIKHFVILPGGTPTPSSAELLGSPRMNELVSELKDRYAKRIIIFDLPSVLDTADTLSFASNLDAALMVVEDDNTKIIDVRSAVDILSATNVIGTVLNKSES